MDHQHWRMVLGFTDRLTAILSLTTAYQQSSSSAAFAEAQSQAKRFESEAYEKASSKEDYDRMCQEAIDAAEATGSVAPIISSPSQTKDNPEEEWMSSEEIGHYKRCFYHVGGIHSTIYKSRSKDGSLVAVKVTTPHLLNAPHDVEREIRLLRQAASSNIIPLLEVFRLDGGRLILVFPFIKYDFDQLLRRDMATASQTRSHLRDLFRALVHLHSLGIVHRDIKPSNLLMDSPEGPAYLADFGIVWKEGDIGSEPTDKKITDVGTTCYRPPEILFGFKEYGVALDLWAAGCVVAEAVDALHSQLFDAGPVGSDLSLIQSIFVTLGTPDEEIWPETQKLPDWGKVEFYKYPAKPWSEVLKGASSKGRDLVTKLVRYESSQRMSAAEALEHPYFSTH